MKKTSKKMSTQKSLEYLHTNGYIAQKVEYYNHFAKRRIDLYGCIDIVAVKYGVQGILGVQATNVNEVNAHIEKIMTECGIALSTWLSSGGKFVIHAWDGKELQIIPLVLREGLIIRGD